MLGYTGCMKAVIVGTAGHIDHGKSALVRALTGTDPDRLEEEKRRGITIDIGFANLDLAAPSGEKIRLGFVDVPGHERFVRNMLAGIGGIDLVLLVVAADESVKPQTREHFDICRLLSVQRGVTVLTKSDLVDAETLEVVRMEVGEYLRESFLDPANSPIVAVSAKTGQGLDYLKRELVRLAADVPVKDTNAAFRLPIDRVFSMKGFGTVVTGTLISGSVRKDEELEVQPTGKQVRVRGVQVHGTSADKAIAGQRTALNLVGAETSELARGMVLTLPGMFRPATRVNVKLNLLPSPKALRDGAQVHLHVYTAETIAEVSLLGAKKLNPGQSMLARLKLDDPVMLLPGDRFVVRQFSPVITIGGGLVLDASEQARRTKAEERLAFLQALEASTEPEALVTRVRRHGPTGLSIGEAGGEMGLPRTRVDSIAADLVKQQKLLRFGDVLVSRDTVIKLRADMKATVDVFHKANPLVAGISKEELREKLGVDPGVFRGVEQLLVHDKQLESAGKLIHAAGRGVVLRDDEAESKRLIETAFASAGLKVPLLKDVLASLPVDNTRAQKIVTLLMRDRVLVKVGDDLVFHRDSLEALRKLVIAQKSKTPKMNVVTFKDLIGVTRKYAIPLLEYLDGERVTRRVGDDRVIL
jgi:selenocysteine-specific elongation factor